MEELRIEKLKLKIKRFNGLMEELSQEFTAIFFEGNEGKLHDVVLEMIKSLDKAQDTVKDEFRQSNDLRISRVNIYSKWGL